MTSSKGKTLSSTHQMKAINLCNLSSRHLAFTFLAKNQFLSLWSDFLNKLSPQLEHDINLLNASGDPNLGIYLHSVNV